MARKSSATVATAAALAREALVENVRKSDASDDRLGDLVLYDLVSGYRAPVDAVATIFRSHGLDPKAALPNAPDWHVAFGRAVEQVGARLREADVRLIDAAKGPNGERRVAIVQLARNGVVTSTDLGTVVCPPTGDARGRAAGTAGGAPYIERDDGRGYAQTVLDAARDFHQVYVIADIRRAITEFIDRWFGLPLRRTQPYIAYWVPSAGGDAIRQLRAAIEECHAGQIELFTGYASDPESARTVVNSVNKGLEAQLAEFRDEVATYTSKATKAEKIETLIETSKALRERASLYKAILGAAVEDVDVKYAEVEAALRARLGIVDSDAAAP